MFAVVVTFTLKPGQRDVFMPLMLENALASKRNEPDCHRFDVCTDPAVPDMVLLYELYTDAAAFRRHLDTAHFKDFDAAAAPLVAEKRVLTFSEVA
ncbi:MAG: putative quinol monooxygenase [Pseudomonadota bacterium]